MKATLYLIALSVSLFLTACSSNEQDALPLSPQFEKVIPNDANLPYRYLQSFEQIQNAKINYIQEDDGLTLLINTGTQKINHMYAVIEQQGSPVMVFLGNSDQQKSFLKGFNSARSFNIKLYGGFKDDSRAVYSTPYLSSTVFSDIPVKGWSVSEPFIKVSSANFPSSLVHLFAELKTKTGSLLVFLARPVSEDFEIPKYGDRGVEGLTLFGRIEYRFNDIQ